MREQRGTKMNTHYDFFAEQHLPLHQVAKSLPPGRNNKPVHVSTILRWIFGGITLPDGSRLRLEAARLGNRWVTSREAVSRFVAAQTAAVAPAARPRPGESARRAEAELAARGV